MRGSLSLFADVFEQPVTTEVQKRKGRSPELNARRNECLIHRYYFYCNFTDKRYSSILDILSSEFFISVVTIPEVIEANFSQLQKLKKDNPAKSFFVKKYPHLSW